MARKAHIETSYRIGIEIEMLITSFNEVRLKTDSFEEYVQVLTSQCNKAIPSQPQTYCDPKIYKMGALECDWFVTTDISIRRDEDKHDQWPVELVSPILKYAEDSGWRDDVRNIFLKFESIGLLEANDTCGLHIHISPAAGEWSLDSLKSLCQCILYYEKAINTIIPEHRRTTGHARNNREENPVFQGKTLRQCVELVNGCKDIYALIWLINDGGGRSFAWNFSNLRPNQRGTVEFRKAPYATSADACLPWAEFVVAFVNAASMSSYQSLIQHDRDVEGLFKFITRHRPSGMRRDILETLFKGKMAM